MFLSFTAFGSVLGNTPSPKQCTLGAVSSGTKRPECEADGSLPCTAQVRNACCHIAIPSYVSVAW
jgi:hypothetical protein